MKQIVMMKGETYNDDATKREVIKGKKINGVKCLRERDLYWEKTCICIRMEWMKYNDDTWDSSNKHKESQS